MALFKSSKKKVNTKTKYGTSNAKMTNIGIKGKKSKSSTGKISLPGDFDMSKFNPNPKAKKPSKGMRTGPIALGEGNLVLPSDFGMKPDLTKFNPNPKKKPVKQYKTGPIALGDGPLVLPNEFKSQLPSSGYNPIVQKTGLNRVNKPGAIQTSGLSSVSKKGSLGSFAKKSGKFLKKNAGGIAAAALTGIMAGVEGNDDGLGALRGIGQAGRAALDMYAPGASQAATAIAQFMQDNVYSKILTKKRMDAMYGRVGQKSQSLGHVLRDQDRKELAASRDARIENALAATQEQSASDQQQNLMNYLVASHISDKKKKKKG